MKAGSTDTPLEGVPPPLSCLSDDDFSRGFLFLYDSNILPVKGLRKKPVRDKLRCLFKVLFLNKLVRFLPVAGPVGELQVIKVRGVSVFCNRNYVIYAGRQRMRISEVEVYGLSAYTTEGLSCKDLFLVLPELRLMSSAVVGSDIGHSVHL